MSEMLSSLFTVHSNTQMQTPQYFKKLGIKTKYVCKFIDYSCFKVYFYKKYEKMDL